MNKRITGLSFGAVLLMYGSIMTVSYTSCNSDTTDKVATAPASDSSASTSDSAAKPAPKKAKKGKASVDLAGGNTHGKTSVGKDGIYTQPEMMPEYPGGQAALSQYVENN